MRQSVILRIQDFLQRGNDQKTKGSRERRVCPTAVIVIELKTGLWRALSAQHRWCTKKNSLLDKGRANALNESIERIVGQVVPSVARGKLPEHT